MFLVLNKSAGLIIRASAIFIIISKDGFAFPDSIPPIVPVPQLQIIESWAKDMDKTFKDLNAITKDAESGAMGYSFRYFVEELNQEKNVKLLSVDGISPSIENIENGTYPLVTNVCLITRKDDSNPYVEKMKEFILSDQGQRIVKETGYSRVN